MNQPKRKPSGAEYRKRAKLKEEGDKKSSEVMKNWFAVRTAEPALHTPATCEEDPHSSARSFGPQSSCSLHNKHEIQLTGGGGLGEEDVSKTVLGEKDIEITEGPSVDDCSLTFSERGFSPIITNQQSETSPNFFFDSDPANWIITNELRDYVAKYGLVQNKNADFALSRRQYGGRFWSFNVNHFSRKLINGETRERVWLVYSEKTASVFCGPCRLFHSDVQQSESSFVKGFNDWKNVSCRLKEHENSLCHRNNILTLKERGDSLGKINSKLTDMVEQEMTYWKMILHRVVVVIKALALRGLPFRGSDEKFGSHNNGNFMMMLETISQFDPFLADHIRKCGNPGSGKTSYLSSTICNEFIELLAKRVLDDIISEAEVSKYYSVIVDSTPDVSHVDQLSMVLRYVKPNGEPVERFIKFLPNVGHKALDMFKAVSETLENLGLDVLNCRGQSYDNASNMSGIYSGLQARILEVSPLAYYVPCAGHSLNLVGSHAADSCLESASFFSMLQEVYNFFHSSTHRLAVLDKFKNTSLTVKSLSTTRWSARYDALRSLKEEWGAIISALEELEKDQEQKSGTRAEARGLVSKLNRLETAIMAQFWGSVLLRLKQVSIYVQKIDVDVLAVVEVLKSLIKFFEELREQFDLCEEKALKVCKKKTYEQDDRRPTVRKLQADETRDGEVVFSGRDKFRVNTFIPIVDKLKEEMKKRMTAYEHFIERFAAITKMWTLTPAELEEEGRKLVEIFKEDLEVSVCDELLHIKSHLLTSVVEEMKPLSLCKWLSGKGLQTLYPNVDILLRMYVSTPVTNASAERSFSCLKRIKNFHRSTMQEKKLNSLALLCIEADLTQCVDFNSTIEAFSWSKARRKKF